MRRFWPVLFLALIPLIPLWKAVFLGEAIGPFDQFRAMAPWNEAPPERPWDVLQADAVLQFYPWRDLVFESWGKGQLPLWNPYELAGTPLLGNSQSGGLYPPHILMGVLHVPTPLAITLLAWLHLFWAGLGVFLLCRRFGANEVGAAAAGAAFSMSAFMLAWTPLASVIATVAWIPWILFGAKGLFDNHPPSAGLGASLADVQERGLPNPTDLRSVERHVRCRLSAEKVARARANRFTATTGACIAMMMLAGHLQFAAYGLLSLALMATFLAVTNWNLVPNELAARTTTITMTTGGERIDEREGVPFSAKLMLSPGLGLMLRCLFALALGLLLASPQLRTVLAYSEYSHRKNSPNEEGYQAYVYGALKPFDLAGLVFPSLQGNPTQPSEIDPNISTFWPGIAKRGGNFAESALAIGPFILFGLVFLSWRKLRLSREGPWLLLGVISLLLCAGTPLNRLLYFGVPGWSSTGSPGRIIVLFVLCACVLGSLGISRALEDLKARDRKGLLLVGIGLVAAILAANQVAATLVSPWMENVNASILGTLSQKASAAALPMVLLLTFAALAACWLPSSHKKAATAIFLLGTSFCTLLSLGFNFVRTSDPNLSVRTELPPHVRIAVVNQPWDLLLRARATLPPNTASILRIHEIGGYDSLLHRDTVGLMHEIVGQDPAPPANGNIMFVKPTFDPEKLADAGVTEVWSPVELSQLGTPSSGLGGLARYRLEGTGRAFTENGPAEILEERFDGLAVQAMGPGTLTVKDRNMPGWSAEIDGTPARMSGGLWREVALPEGTHKVSFNYNPPGLDFRPLWVGLALGVLLVLFPRQRRA